MATSRSMLRCSSHVRSKLVKASADTRGLPYMRAAEDVGRMGLPLITVWYIWLSLPISRIVVLIFAQTHLINGA